MCSLLCPKVSAKKIHYSGKILGETDFIDLISYTGKSVASNFIYKWVSNLKLFLMVILTS